MAAVKRKSSCLHNCKPLALIPGCAFKLSCRDVCKTHTQLLVSFLLHCNALLLWLLLALKVHPSLPLKEHVIAALASKLSSHRGNPRKFSNHEMVLQERRKDAGIKGVAQPNMVCSSAVHVCWEKLFNYFDIEPRYINLTEDCFVAKPEKVLSSVNGHVALVLGSLCALLIESAAMHKCPVHLLLRLSNACSLSN